MNHNVQSTMAAGEIRRPGWNGCSAFGESGAPAIVRRVLYLAHGKPAGARPAGRPRGESVGSDIEKSPEATADRETARRRALANIRQGFFGPDAIHLMQTAFANACRSLGGSSAPSVVKERIAKYIIACAMGGNVDPDRLCEATIEMFIRCPATLPIDWD